MDFPKFKADVTGPDFGFVYVMTYPGSKKVKIGHSLDPISRAAQIGGTQAPEKPALEVCIWCSERQQEVEKLAHKLGSAYRTRGEWFDVDVESAKSYLIDAASELGIERRIVFDRKGRRWVYSLPETPQNSPFD